MSVLYLSGLVIMCGVFSVDGFIFVTAANEIVFWDFKTNVKFATLIMLKLLLDGEFENLIKVVVFSVDEFLFVVCDGMMLVFWNL